MPADFTLVEAQFGDDVDILINDVNGNPDDLTVYDTVSIIISVADFSSNTFNLVSGTDTEVITTQFADGIITWRPSSGKPVPAFGFYWLQVVRNSTTIQKPARKFFLEVIRRVPPT